MNKLVMPAAVIQTAAPAWLTVRLTEVQADCFATMVEHNPSHQWHVEISKPRKPRTTGERSQNHHLNGHCQQLAQETGNDFDTVKYAVKYRAIPGGYPYDTMGDLVVPWSESRVDTVQCAVAIVEAHRLADELGIKLIEEESDEVSL